MAQKDAGNTSPASAKLACTTGATSDMDTKASFSNFGAVRESTHVPVGFNRG